jgi:hypothetical protein
MAVFKNPEPTLALAMPVFFSVSKPGMAGSNKIFTGKPTS